MMRFLMIREIQLVKKMIFFHSKAVEGKKGKLNLLLLGGP